MKYAQKLKKCQNLWKIMRSWARARVLKSPRRMWTSDKQNAVQVTVGGRRKVSRWRPNAIAKTFYSHPSLFSPSLSFAMTIACGGSFSDRRRPRRKSVLVVALQLDWRWMDSLGLRFVTHDSISSNPRGYIHVIPPRNRNCCSLGIRLDPPLSSTDFQVNRLRRK